MGSWKKRKTVSGTDTASDENGGAGRDVRLPRGFAVRSPFPARSIIGSTGGLSRVRYAAPNCGAPWTPHPCSRQHLLTRGKGERWKSLPYAQRSTKAQRLAQRSTGWSSLSSDCPKKTRFRMGQSICFEASRLFQTQSSRTALSCSRKWMSGHADALAELKRIVSGKSKCQCQARPDASGNSFTESRRSVFSLDIPLSWMSLEKESPEPRKVHPPELGRVISIPQVGGLHPRYERRAA